MWKLILKHIKYYTLIIVVFCVYSNGNSVRTMYQTIFSQHGFTFWRLMSLWTWGRRSRLTVMPTPILNFLPALLSCGEREGHKSTQHCFNEEFTNYVNIFIFHIFTWAKTRNYTLNNKTFYQKIPYEFKQWKNIMSNKHLQKEYNRGGNWLNNDNIRSSKKL